MIRNYQKRKSCGFLVIAVTLALLALAVVSIAFVTTVQREADMFGATTKHHKAWSIAKAGLERATVTLAHDGNWADTPATLYNAVSYGEGAYTVTTTNAAQDAITVISQGTVDDSTQVVSRNLLIDADDNFPGFLTFLGSNTQLSGNHIDRAYLENSGLYNAITIDKVRITFDQPLSQVQTNIRFKPTSGGGWNTVWNGSAAIGTVIDVDNTTIQAGDSHQIRVYFSPPFGSDDDYTVTLEIHLSDGSIHVSDGFYLGD